MSVIETHATASHRYYMNKRKTDIIDRLIMLHREVYKEEPSSTLKKRWSNSTKDDLASRAMCYHRGLPS